MIKRLILAFWRRISVWLYLPFPVQKNKIVVSSYYGNGYGDNPKYIVEELLRRKLDLDIVWIVRDKSIAKSLPQGVRYCVKDSLLHNYHMATAKVWIDNCRKSFFYKKKSQYYIQTWHGDIGLKKVEKDAEKALAKSYVKWAKRDSKAANLFISGNAWEAQKYRDAFWYDGEILICGYPRRDILYKDDIAIDDLKAQIGIPLDCKVLFYAPTFRKCIQKPDMSVYNLAWDDILEAARQRWGGKWIGMIRLHPNIAAHSKELHLPKNVIDMSQYPDMQELLAVSDVCLSDYSSSVFEFAVTGKPAFIFATDFEDYKKDRDVYFSFDDLPFQVAQSNNELHQHILSFSDVDYKLKHAKFYNDTIGICEEGKASIKIADIIKGICN